MPLDFSNQGTLVADDEQKLPDFSSGGIPVDAPETPSAASELGLGNAFNYGAIGLASRIPQIAKSVATNGVVQTAKDELASSQLPVKSIPKLAINPDDSIPAAVGKEAVNTLSSLAEFSESPMGVGTLATGGVGGILPRVIAGGFGAQAFHSLGEQILDTHKDWLNMTPAQKAAAVTDMVATGAMAGLLTHATVKGVPDAQAILRNKGKLPTSGQTTQGSEETSSNDIQQTAPVQPEPLGAREENAPQAQGPKLSVDDEGNYVLEMAGMEPQKFDNREDASIALDKLKQRQPLSTVVSKPVPPVESQPVIPKPSPTEISPDYVEEAERQALDKGVGIEWTDKLPENEGEQPFASGEMSTINRATGNVVINPKVFNGFLDSLPINVRPRMIKAIVQHEHLHLATSDMDAAAYAKTLSPIERGIRRRSYLGKWGTDSDLNDTLLGHEAIRYRLEQLQGLDHQEILQAAGLERWTLRNLDMIEHVIRSVRERTTDADGRAHLDKILGNIKVGKIAAGSVNPMALDSSDAMKEMLEEQANEFDKQADEYSLAGEMDAAKEMRDRAFQNRSWAKQQDQQSFPMALVPREKLEEQQKNPVFFRGNVVNGAVNSIKLPNLSFVKSHSSLGVGNGSRWTWDGNRSTVRWTDTPTKEDVDSVDNYLHKHGLVAGRHEDWISSYPIRFDESGEPISPLVPFARVPQGQPDFPDFGDEADAASKFARMRLAAAGDQQVIKKAEKQKKANSILESQPKQQEYPMARIPNQNGDDLRQGSYWMHPSGKLVYATEGHRKFGEDMAKGTGKSPFDFMDEKGFVRVVVHGRDIIFFTGQPSASQLSELKNLAIERGVSLVHDTSNLNKRTIIELSDRSQGALPLARLPDWMKKKPANQEEFMLPGAQTRKPQEQTVAGAQPYKVGYTTHGDRTNPSAAQTTAGEVPKLSPEEQAKLESNLQSKIPQKMDTVQVQKIADDYIGQKMSGEEGTIKAPPSFKEFAHHMVQQGRLGLMPGKLRELYADTMGRWISSLTEKLPPAIQEYKDVNEAYMKKERELADFIRNPEYSEEEARKLSEVVKTAKSNLYAAEKQLQELTALPNYDLARYNELKDSVFGLTSAIPVLEKRLRSFKVNPLADSQHTQLLRDQLSALRSQMEKLRPEYEEASGHGKIEKNQKTRTGKLTWLGSMYIKAMEPMMEASKASAQRKTVKPEDIRFGGGILASAYQDLDESALKDKNLGEILTDDARRNETDSATLTKRVTLLHNKKTGEIELASTFRNPSTDKVMMKTKLRQSWHSLKTNSDLDWVKSHYDIRKTILLDEPVKDFNMSWKNWDDYQEKFGSEALDRYNSESSYDPQRMSAQEFIQTTGGGRMEYGKEGLPPIGYEGEEGHLMGPEKQLIAETGPSAIEIGRKKPLAPQEVSALRDFLTNEWGGEYPDTQDKIEKTLYDISDYAQKSKQYRPSISASSIALDRLMERLDKIPEGSWSESDKSRLKKLKNSIAAAKSRTETFNVPSAVVSALAKIGRMVQHDNPEASANELMKRMAYEINKDKSIEGLLLRSEKEAGSEVPETTGTVRATKSGARELSTLREIGKSPTAIPGEILRKGEGAPQTVVPKQTAAEMLAPEDVSNIERAASLRKSEPKWYQSRAFPHTEEETPSRSYSQRGRPTEFPRAMVPRQMLEKARQDAVDKYSRLKGAMSSAQSQNKNMDAMSGDLDAAETIRDNMGNIAQRSVVMDSMKSNQLGLMQRIKNFNGDKGILNAALAVVSSRGWKSRHPVSHESEMEMNRLVMEDEGFKAKWKNVKLAEQDMAEKKKDLDSAVARLDNFRPEEIQKFKDDYSGARKEWLNRRVSLHEAMIKHLLKSGFMRASDTEYTWDEKTAKEGLEHLESLLNDGLRKANEMIGRKSISPRQHREWLAGIAKLSQGITDARKMMTDPRLQATALRAIKENNRQYDWEIEHNRPLNFDEWYLPGRYDGSLFTPNEVLFEQTKILGKNPKMPKKYQTYYHAIAEGPFVPVTTDVGALVGHRVRAGVGTVNHKLWAQHLTNLTDETSGQKVLIPAKYIDPASGTKTEAVGERKNPITGDIEQAPLKVPSGGKLVGDMNHTKQVDIFGDTYFALDGYDKLIHQLIDPSAVQNNILGRAMLNMNLRLKHIALVGDIFHLSRITSYASSISGLKKVFGSGHTPGWAALEFREEDIPRALEKGLIGPETAKYLTEKVMPWDSQKISRIGLAKQFQQNGFNVGRIADAIRQDLVKNWPIVGSYNKFLFNQWTRGLMMRGALDEYERISKANPEMNSKDITRKIAKDLNVYFGSIGRQGWIKSKTFQDLARITFLAPQWVEGLMKKEGAIMYRAVRHPIESGRSALGGLGGKHIGMDKGRDTTVRAMARGMVAMLVLTQVTNLITQKRPTWKNDKEHLWDAYMGENVWLSPLSLFNEITGDIIRYNETKPTAWDAVQQVGENKLGFWGRAATILLSGRNPQGQAITTTSGRLSSAASQMIPLPITANAPIKQALSMIPHSPVGAVDPSQLVRSGLAVAGLKAHVGQKPMAQISQMAADFNKKNNLTLDNTMEIPTDEPGYDKLRHAIGINDDRAAQSVFNDLVKTRNPVAIYNAMKMWERRPFTGSNKNERLFLAGLDDEDLNLYTQAVSDRRDMFLKFQDFMQKQNW